MDVRYTPEQLELRRTARQLSTELGPRTVFDLDDDKRADRIATAVRDAGWLELRHDDGEGAPLATGVEAAVIAEALAWDVADAAFSGPVLAADLARRVGVEPAPGAVVAFSASLVEAATESGKASTADAYAVDCGSGFRSGSGSGSSSGSGPGLGDTAYVLVPDAGGHRLAQLQTGEAAPGTDLTRSIRRIPAGTAITEVPGQSRSLTPDDLASFGALGLALTSADLLGVMRGLIDHSVRYASERRQYGVPIGSFQAVQHLLAEAQCLMEGAFSVALHAAWAVDDLAPDDALQAGRVAKAYCARAARTVSETAVQVYGGMGNTWECIVHVYLRRALLSSQWLGDDGVQLLELQNSRLGSRAGGTDGLS